MLTSACVAFQQLTGINLVLFNTQAIFDAAGSQVDPAVSTIIVGAVLFGISAITPLIVDRINRRTLLMASGAGTALTTVSNNFGWSSPGRNGSSF